jgi:phosphoribosylformylglycinamidine (FGAM) synthase-like enzyme
LLKLQTRGSYLTGSAIAEGGIFLRLFEAAYGSGLGARVELEGLDRRVRADGLLFGEFIGSVCLEIPPELDLEKEFGDLPFRVLGEVVAEPRLILSRGGKVVCSELISSLAESWAKPFREIVE